MSTPLYAVGDIHGQSAQMDHALDLIRRDGGDEAEIVFLGDYVDRGPDSPGVIQRLIDGLAAGRNWHVLRGNHDQMFWRFCDSGDDTDPNILSGVGWLHPRLGGAQTLACYGIEDGETRSPEDLFAEARKKIPAAHPEFLGQLKLYHEAGPLLFVHAGIRPGVPLAEQDPDELIWIRDPFTRSKTRHPWLVVHGHTPVEHPSHFGNRIDLDGGAGYGRPLIPAVFEGERCWLLTEQGRKPLRKSWL